MISFQRFRITPELIPIILYVLNILVDEIIVDHPKFHVFQRTKSACILALLDSGYARDRTVMVGDAPGDCDAAMDNGVYYYPILVGQEEKSWNRFPETVLKRLLQGTYGGEWQEQMVREFRGNLS